MNNTHPDWSYNSAPFINISTPPSNPPTYQGIIDLTSDNDDDDDFKAPSVPPPPLSKKRSRTDFETRQSLSNTIDLTAQPPDVNPPENNFPNKKPHPLVQYPGRFEPSDYSDFDPCDDQAVSTEPNYDEKNEAEGEENTLHLLNPVELTQDIDPYAPPNLVRGAHLEDSRPVRGYLERELELEIRVEVLKRQVRELHGFVIEQGLMSKAPPSIRTQLEKRPNSTQELASTIRKSIETEYEKMQESEGDEPPRRSGVTSDDYSSSMWHFVADIKRLSDFPEGLILAFDLLVFLAGKTYSEMHELYGYGDRPSDGPIDDLLCDLSVRRMGAYPWFPEKAFVDTLKRKAKMMDDSGVEGYLVKSIKILSDFQHVQ